MAVHRIKFTGKFLEFFLMNIGLSILTVFTLGLAFFYQVYWNQKYFVEHLEIEI